MAAPPPTSQRLGSRSGGGLPKLAIPMGNVPGALYGEAGEGGWRAPPPNSNTVPVQPLPRSQPLPYPSSTPPPHRPSLSVPTPPPTHPAHFASSSSSISSSSRRPSSPSRLPALSINPTPTPPLKSRGSGGTGLSLAIPRLTTAPGVGASSSEDLFAGGMGGYGGNNGAYDDYNDGGGYYGGPRTPVAGSSRGGGLGTDQYLTNSTAQGYHQGGGGQQQDKTITSVPAELRQALAAMRLGGSATPGRRPSSDSRRPSIDVDGLGLGSGGSGAATPNSSHTRSRNNSNASSIHAGSVSVMELKAAAAVGPDTEELDPANFESLERLGEGAGGAVEKVKDRRTGRVLAMKVIPTSPNPAIHKQILRELQILNECKSPYIVNHFGSFLTSQDTCIGILMEYCEAGSLDSLVRRIKKLKGRTSEKVLGRIAESILGGLDYLHEIKIVHRDIKPSNIVMTRKGEVKLCDFGVSGELVNSMAGTFTGTSFYMAPERIQGQAYSIKADVWSCGLTLHEVAHNRFPFPPEGEPPLSGPIELLNFIVAQPVPRMIDSQAEGIQWTEKVQDFVSKCLIRDDKERPYPRDLLKHPWIIESSQRNINMAKWVAAICQFPA